MVAISLTLPDPTLEASDRELEARAALETPRTYLGMSALGGSCSRKLWYNYHQPIRERFNAATLKRFDDGHRSEDVMADRLRLVPGLKIWTVDPDTGRQFAMADFDDRLKGHADGVVLGLLQAPTTPHVWEGKSVNETKFKKLGKLKAEFGEKAAFRKWDEVYWCQGQLYMGYMDLTRHYLTVCTPSVREWDSCRTDFDPVAFIQLKEKARRILDSTVPLAKVSESPSWFECKFCQYSERCHGGRA